jgi:hypothetical protein
VDDAALRKRIDAALALLVANFVLLLALAFRFTPEAAIGTAVILALIGIGHYRSGA